MNKQQEDFCYYYVSSYNGAAAYRKAYGEDVTDNSYRLLKNPEVKAKIAELRKDKLDALCVDASRVLEEIAGIAFAADEKASDKLKALSLLVDTLGMKTQKVETSEVIKVEITD